MDVDDDDPDRFGVFRKSIPHVRKTRMRVFEFASVTESDSENRWQQNRGYLHRRLHRPCMRNLITPLDGRRFNENPLRRTRTVTRRILLNCRFTASHNDPIVVMKTLTSCCWSRRYPRTVKSDIRSTRVVVVAGMRNFEPRRDSYRGDRSKLFKSSKRNFLRLVYCTAFEIKKLMIIINNATSRRVFSSKIRIKAHSSYTVGMDFSRAIQW